MPGRSVPASTGIRYFGEAHGSSANVADRVVAGRSFPVYMGSCGTLRPPLTMSNTGATVNARPHVTTGAIDTTASALDVSGTRTARTSATTHSVNVLSGLITADEVRAVSATSNDNSGFHTSGAGSRLANLVVAGIPILVLPGPNTRIDLAGIGHVILNEQVSNIQPASASLAVNMIHVVVTLTNPLVPVGTNIVVSHAKSRLAATNIAGTLDGFSYGTVVMQGKLFASGPSALMLLGCNGTNGAVKTNSVVGLDFEPGFATSVVTNTVSGAVTSTSATGETTSTVEAASLLSALVTADVIRADAHSFTDGNAFTFTDTGSSFVNLSVAGFPNIDDDVPPNTRVSLAGLGDLWLKREIFRPNSIEVRMIQIIVNQANVYGIPIGTDMRVAVAHASAH